MSSLKTGAGLEPGPTEDGPDGHHPGPSVEHPRGVDDPRVYLAAERTFLAWVRTSLALMGFGFLIARFHFLIRATGALSSNPDGRLASLSPWLGFAMVIFGVALCVISLFRHRDYIDRLERGILNPPSSKKAPVVVAAILALVGLAMAVTILTL